MTDDKAATPLRGGLLHCPRCSKEMAGDARVCPNCGSDLVLIALLAERAYIQGIPGTAPIVGAPEAFVPRIGEILLSQDIISRDQLDAALDKQRELREQGSRRLLGQTLVEMGIIDRITLDRIINDQIIELQAALQKANQTLEERVAERTDKLRDAVKRLSELNELKANFISNVSHELRTPLSHIMGYVELLAEEELGQLTDEQRMAMSVMRRATGRLERLVQDLVEFSTASREGVRLDLQSISMAKLAAGVADNLQEKAASAGVELTLTLGRDPALVNADAQRMAWVLFQLVDNGIKFTPRGGIVSLGVDGSDELVTAYVKDTGIGIPSDRVDEIFEPFHQLDASSTRRFGGTGLGLAMVKVILEAHGTHLEIETEKGEGSSFSFSLPAEARPT